VQVLDVADGVLANFQQDAAGARGVDEEVEVSPGAGLDLFGDEPHALRLEGFERGFDVADLQRDVVQAFATLREEASDGGFGRSGLEQLNAGIACGD
jgi:hypothetical protein